MTFVTEPAAIRSIVAGLIVLRRERGLTPAQLDDAIRHVRAQDPLLRLLVALRRERGIGQRELDDRCGWADGYVEKLEAGTRLPSVKCLQFWAAGLDHRLTVAPA